MDICSISSLEIRGMIGTYHMAEVATGLESPLVPPKKMWAFFVVFLADETENLFQVGVQLKTTFTNLEDESLPISWISWMERRNFHLCYWFHFRVESCSFYQGLLTSDVTRMITQGSHEMLSFATYSFQTSYLG